MTYLKRFAAIPIILSIMFSAVFFAAQECRAEGDEVYFKSIAYNFYRMHFIDDKTGWVCGKSGYLYRTHDGGMHWKRLPTNTVNSLFGIHFFDTNHGVIVGQSGMIIRTDNGGDSWTKVDSPVEKSFLTLDFYDSQNGMAAGDWGKIIATSDGGKTWRDVSIDEDILLYYIKYTGPQEIWMAAEMGVVFHSTNGGQTWDRLQLSNGTLFGLDMNDEGYGFAVNVEGMILNTQDGGATWEEQKICKESLYSVKMAGDTAIAIGDVGVIYILNYKKDKTWRKIEVPNELRANWLHAIEVLEDEKFIIAGARGSISFIQNGQLSRPDS